MRRTRCGCWHDCCVILSIAGLVLYDGEVRFHSKAMGKHKYLLNSNVMSIVPDEIRTLVVSSTEQKVMEVNKVSAKSVKNNVYVENSLWMPVNYFYKFPECAQGTRKE